MSNKLWIKITTPAHFFLGSVKKDTSRLSRISLRWILALSALFIFYNYLRGVRSPNLWSATQFLWNYEFGVIRRAFVGNIVHTLGIDSFYTYANFFYFSHAILLLQLALLFAWFKYCLHYLSRGGIYLSHWFTSLAIVVHIHFVGYLDNILVFLMLGLALLPFRPVLMILLCILGTLCHELFLFLGVPLLVFRAAVLIFTKKSKPEQRRILVFTAGAAVAICTFITYHLTFGHASTYSNESAVALEQSLSTHTNFPFRRDNLDILRRKNSDAVDYATTFLLQDGARPVLTSAAAMLPSILFNCFLFGVMLSKSRVHALKWPLMLCYVAACFSPLLLFPLAWDYLRWFSLMGLLSFLLILTWISATKEKLAIDSPALGLCYIIISAFTLMGNIQLFDGYFSAIFPFTEHWIYLGGVWAGIDPFPRMPGY